MSLLKENLTKKEKVVKIVSLLLFAVSMGCMILGYIEEKKADIAYEKLQESYESYEDVVINELEQLRDSSRSIIQVAYAGDTKCYNKSVEVYNQSNDFINEYKNYVYNDEDTINEIHAEVLNAVGLINDGTELLNDTLYIVISNGFITQDNIDNQSKAMETIATGSNYLGNLIEQIQYKSY